MKRFRFPLRPVAILRAHQELKAREVFAGAVQAFMQSERELAETRERLRNLEQSVTAGRAGVFSAADEINTLAAYRRECDGEVAAQKAMGEAKQLMEQRRLEYIEAHRRLEVVKRLEQKARALHHYELSREEQAEFDDYANRQFGGRQTLNSA